MRDKTYLIGHSTFNPWDDVIALSKLTIKCSYENKGFYPKIYFDEFSYDGIVEVKKMIKDID